MGRRTGTGFLLFVLIVLSGISAFAGEAERYFALGMRHRDKREYKEAIAAFNKAAELDPLLVDAYVGLGLAYHESGRYYKAMEALKKALELEPPPETKVFIHRRMGDLYFFQIRSYLKAIEEYEKAIEIEPVSHTYILIGSCYSEMGNEEEAERSFTKAVEADPRNAMAHFKLGVCYTRQELYEKAIEAYQKSIRYNPDYWEAHLNLGYLYKDLNIDDAKAIEAFEKTRTLNPRSPEVLECLAELYIKRGEFEKAGMMLNGMSALSDAGERSTVRVSK
jgi:tetratricopeptide (TPR) repeat protein